MAIELESIREESFEEMDLPLTVYKYRDWNNSRHKSIITKRQVWLAKPSSFEDPLDCKSSARYDLLTNQQIYEKYLYESKEDPEHKGWSRQQHRKHARIGELSDIDDTSYNRYSLQQSLYKYILEKNYGIEIGSMYLIVIHPDYDKYYKIKVPYLRDKIEYILMTR